MITYGEVFYSFIDQDRLVSYPISQWLCTDTHVGCEVYFLDDEFVAISMQTARKSSTVFEWKSQESFDTVREFVKTLIEEEEVFDSPNIIDNLDEDWGIGYQINYNGCLFREHEKEATLDGESVEIIERLNGMCAKEVKIKHSNFKEEWIDVEKLLFRWKTI